MNDIANSPSSSVSTLKDAELIEPMQKSEISWLKKCEEIIGRNLKEFFEVGKALTTIKNDRLYRKAFKTFEQYCEEKWDFGRKRAYQLINASHVLERMSTIVDIPLPKNEAQIRPLLKLPKEKITETWQEFISEKGSEAISAKDITSFIEIRNRKNKPTKNKRIRNVKTKNELIAKTFELSQLISELKEISNQYPEINALQSITSKLYDCSEFIQEKYLSS